MHFTFLYGVGFYTFLGKRVATTRYDSYPYNVVIGQAEETNPEQEGK